MVSQEAWARPSEVAPPVEDHAQADRPYGAHLRGGAPAGRRPRAAARRRRRRAGTATTSSGSRQRPGRDGIRIGRSKWIDLKSTIRPTCRRGSPRRQRRSRSVAVQGHAQLAARARTGSGRWRGPTRCHPIRPPLAAVTASSCMSRRNQVHRRQKQEVAGNKVERHANPRRQAGAAGIAARCGASSPAPVSELIRGARRRAIRAGRRPVRRLIAQRTLQAEARAKRQVAAGDPAVRRPCGYEAAVDAARVDRCRRGP